jgi:hypothetical protein
VLTLGAQLACGGDDRTVAPTPGRVRPSVPAATQIVSATPSIAAANFSCRLPVSGFSSAPGGFVLFPAGEYSPEAADRLPTDQFPPDLGMSYGQQLQRWLPVRRQQVSPDGRTYAYVSFTYQDDGRPTSDGVDVVDAATGRERLRIPNRAAPALPWFVASFDATGLYLSGRQAWSGGHPQSVPEGLALADPLSGRVRAIADSGSWAYIGGGAAWGMDAASGQPSYGLGTKLLRLDLGTGAQQTWLSRVVDLRLVGVDRSGHPLVELNSGSAGRTVDRPKLWLVPGPDQLVELQPAAGGDPPELGPSGSVMEDGHGIWITPAQAELWLDRPTTGLQLVHRFEDGITRAIAGSCA